MGEEEIEKETQFTRFCNHNTINFHKIACSFIDKQKQFLIFPSTYTSHVQYMRAALINIANCISAFHQCLAVYYCCLETIVLSRLPCVHIQKQYVYTQEHGLKLLTLSEVRYTSIKSS